MSNFGRRDFLRFTGAGLVAASSLGIAGTASAQSANKSGALKRAHVVIIGGGFGGATCARYLKLQQPELNVTLIEAEKQYITGPFSNYVIAGMRALPSITHRYDTLQKNYGIQVVHDLAVGVDTAKRKVKLKNGKVLSYDRLVVSPGIDMTWGAIKYYDPGTASTMPHAWKPGTQTLQLRKRLEAMRNGGRFIISAPLGPYRCPPGPYERASVVAHYFKRHKPRSKIIILDAKDDFTKKELFLSGWEKLYPGMIEWVPGAKGGAAKRVNIASMTVETEIEKFKGDVVNVIPPQHAGRIAYMAGLVDKSGWCPIHPLTMESKKRKGVYVIGDSAIAGDMPKSGFSANSQAKIAASAIVADLQGRPASEASYVNTCYSLLAPNYGISIAGVYRATADGIKSIPGAGGVSPKDADANFRAEEAKYALGWYQSITADTFG